MWIATVPHEVPTQSVRYQGQAVGSQAIPPWNSRTGKVVVCGTEGTLGADVPMGIHKASRREHSGETEV